MGGVGDGYLAGRRVRVCDGMIIREGLLVGTLLIRRAVLLTRMKGASEARLEVVRRTV